MADRSISWPLLAVADFLLKRLSLTPPEFPLDPQKASVFEDVYRALLEESAGTAIDELPYPRHEFLCYLAGHKGILLHGSNR